MPRFGLGSLSRMIFRRPSSNNRPLHIVAPPGLLPPAQLPACCSCAALANPGPAAGPGWPALGLPSTVDLACGPAWRCTFSEALLGQQDGHSGSPPVSSQASPTPRHVAQRSSVMVHDLRPPSTLPIRLSGRVWPVSRWGDCGPARTGYAARVRRDTNVPKSGPA